MKLISQKLRNFRLQKLFPAIVMLLRTLCWSVSNNSNVSPIRTPTSFSNIDRISFNAISSQKKSKHESN